MYTEFIIVYFFVPNMVGVFRKYKIDPITKVRSQH